MKNTFIYTIITLVLLSSISARAVDQETLDYMIFIIIQPERVSWAESSFDAPTLIEGFNQVYAIGEASDDDYLCRNVLWAMASTDLLEFEQPILDAIPDYPYVALSSLVALPSGTSVATIVQFVNDDDPLMRDHAVVLLGIFDEYDQFHLEALDALAALNDRLTVETEPLVIDSINWAILEIEQQGPFE